MRAHDSEESRPDFSPPVSRGAGRRRRVIKGPGVAVRAPPGTKYLLYGLVVLSGDPPLVRSSASEKRIVYISGLDDDGGGGSGGGVEATSGMSTTTPAFTATPAVAGSAAASGGGVCNVREYNHMMDTVLLLPLGDTPEERSTVRGYAWGGNMPSYVRPCVWRLLCGYMPCAPATSSRQQAELRRKREEYGNFVAKYYNITITDFMQPSALRSMGSGSGKINVSTDNKILAHTSVEEMKNTPTRSTSNVTAMPISPDDRAILSQIALDIPRHSYAIFHLTSTASALARCFFLWSRRYPAVGYVQGIDDIMAVFFLIFLEGAFHERNMRTQRHTRENNTGARGSGNGNTIAAVEEEDVWIPASVAYSKDVRELGAAMEKLSADLFEATEAGTYFCGGFFLSWLQDNFVHGQPGILRSMTLMEKVIKNVDRVLLDSILSHGVRLMDCCFQWIHCLLARELPMDLLVLLWDKYLAIGNSETVLDFHAYICSALLMKLREKVIGKSVEVVIQLLKDPLERRVQSPQEHKNDGSVYNRLWLESIISTASQLLRDYPVCSLT